MSLFDAWQPETHWLERFSIKPAWLERLPSELSGGELARIMLLRALDPRTKILIADEITAQLDICKRNLAVVSEIIRKSDHSQLLILAITKRY